MKRPQIRPGKREEVLIALSITNVLRADLGFESIEWRKRAVKKSQRRLDWASQSFTRRQGRHVHHMYEVKRAEHVLHGKRMLRNRP